MTPKRYSKVKEIFEAALSQDDAGREVFLNSACGSDTTLRRLIRQMLKEHFQACGILDDSSISGGSHKEVTPGQELGHYMVEAQLGEGGMGKVYRAHDTRLGRAVAIKVLGIAVADEEGLRRFMQEAKATSNLNHPNIVTVYDLDTIDGVNFIVMEHVEGDTLSRLTTGKGLACRETLSYAVQIADALASAHAKGIIHRDIKPANIMITHEGQAKVLDFGLAKLTQHSAGGDWVDVLGPNWKDKHQTEKGAVLGTVAYMSPEQAEGQEVDARSDIFSFGSVLYEMVTGCRAFPGETKLSVLSAILRDEPKPIRDLAKDVPHELERIIFRCLQKDRARRFQHVDDLKVALLELKEDFELGHLLTPASETVGWRRRRAVAVCLITAAVAGAVYFGITKGTVRREPRDREGLTAVRLLVPPPENTRFGSSVSVSPDGQRLAFVASGSDGKQILWIRRLDSLLAQPLSGTEGAYLPFWSPDNRFVGFFANGKLKKIEASGGSPQTVCDAPNGRGGAWGRDGVIVLAPGMLDSLYRVGVAGGRPVPVTTVDSPAGENSHRWPQFLPDGRHFLYYARMPQQENSVIYAGSLDSKERRRILTVDSNVVFVWPQNGETGYLLYLRDQTLLAQPFDASLLKLTGEAYPIAEQVGYSLFYSVGEFSASNTGLLSYLPGDAYPTTQLLWFDRGGKQLAGIGAPDRYGFPRLSPDGEKVAVERIGLQTQKSDIWLLELSHGTGFRFTSHPSRASSPLWSPDGTRIVFASTRDGSSNLYQKPSSGAGVDELLFKTPEYKYPSDWSQDGRFILYNTLDEKTRWNLWVLPLQGNRKPFPFVQTPFDEKDGQFIPAPRGLPRWVAYVSNESGAPEVYVESLSGPAGHDGPSSPPVGKWQISTNGGTQPRWRRDGKELFYISGDGKLMAVPVEIKTNNRFAAGVPQPLFQTRIASGELGLSYAPSADGRRFLLNTPLEQRSSALLTIVLNWTAGLKR